MYFTIFCQANNVYVLFDQIMVRRHYTSAEVVKLFEQDDNEVLKLLIHTYHEVTDYILLNFRFKCIQAGSVNMIKSIIYTQPMNIRLPCLSNLHHVFMY